ncbi:TRAP transporter small permease subunit [Oceanibium sediminis]|uniref:TRAP transporter small permease subunit n=1 Tax=Oceanibium sediminis TaxID=2026339 RepID=UPI000DD4A808|nr:TRAP transporter small permease subunit [Oceanibium sediminis]
MIDGLVWVITNLVAGFLNIFRALAQTETWLDWSDKEALGRFIYYGGSTEFFFSVTAFFLSILAAGLVWRRFLWGVVVGLEGVANTLGRLFAWAGLLMVLQQVMIVFLQRIFRVSEISFGPFGYAFARDLSWWSEELKLYNAMIVVLCCAYTFVQGGHVRVDLFYAGMRFRAKKVVDMLGSLLFILPSMTLTWLFGWYFMWRHLVTPKINATETLEATLRKSKLMKWNVETIGFSPNGFDAYFLFKLLLVTFAGMMFVQGWAFFYRSLLEFLEGEQSAGKYLDKDVLEDTTAEHAAETH